jgi:hypothetical protein
LFVVTTVWITVALFWPAFSERNVGIDWLLVLLRSILSAYVAHLFLVAYLELIRKILHLDGCRDKRLIMEDDV